MPNEPNSTLQQASLIPPQPVPEGAKDFIDRVHGLLDGKEKDEATVARALEGMDAMLDTIAAGLYSLASMLVGEGEDAGGYSSADVFKLGLPITGLVFVVALLVEVPWWKAIGLIQ